MHVTYDIEFYGPNTMTNTIYLGAIKGVVEMAEHLGKQGYADKYRALYEKASVLVDEMLFNGEYYIQELEDVDAYRYQYGMVVLQISSLVSSWLRQQDLAICFQRSS